MKKTLLFAAAAVSLGIGAAPAWHSAAALRCTFDGPLPPGVKAEGQYRSVPGIKGKGARFSRSGWNSIYYFLEKPSPEGAVAVCPALSVVRGNSVSFMAQGKGEMILTFRSGSKEEKRIIRIDAEKMTFFNTVFTAPEKLGTVTFKAVGIKWDQPQVTAGWEYPSFHAPIRKIVKGCYLEIDPAKKYLDLDKGAFALWVKTPYLNSSVAMDHIGIFGIDHALKPIKRHPDQQILCLTAWNGGSLNAYRMARQNGGRCSVSLPLKELQFKKEEWHHILLNWERRGKELALELYIDGGKHKLYSTRAYGRDKSVKRITVGFSDYAWLNGDADDLVIFKRPLKAQEVKELFEAKGNWK